MGWPGLVRERAGAQSRKWVEPGVAHCRHPDASALEVRMGRFPVGSSCVEMRVEEEPVKAGTLELSRLG